MINNNTSSNSCCNHANNSSSSTSGGSANRNKRRMQHNNKTCFRKVAPTMTTTNLVVQSSASADQDHQHQLSTTSSSTDFSTTNVNDNSKAFGKFGGLKCCSYNVHVFKSASGEHSFEQFIDYLTVGQDGSDPFDIIGLNEAFETKKRKGALLTPLPQIENSLSKYYNTEYKCYYAPVSKTMGNCIVTRLPVKRTQLWRLSKGPGGVRNVLGMQLDLTKCQKSSPPVEFVFLTHLDFMSEEWRVKQFSELLSFMEKFMKGNVKEATTSREPLNSQKAAAENNYIVMGDFNAMYKPDYTQEFWDQIQLDRSKQQWEPAVSTLMDFLLRNDNSDQQQKKIKLYDSWRICNRDLQFNGRNLSSSRLKTRIDYILCSKSLQKKILHSVIDSRMKTTQISDHNPVITHFSLAEEETEH